MYRDPIGSNNKDSNAEPAKPEETTNKDSNNEPEEPPPAGKDLPKRILAFTTRRLLQLFAKSIRGSLDGTFKSCCKLWCQQFVWMVKYNGRLYHDFLFISIFIVFITMCTLNTLHFIAMHFTAHYWTLMDLTEL